MREAVDSSRMPPDPRRPRRRRPRRGLAAGAATAVLATVLAGCGGSDGGVPTLTWYINPDNGSQAELASRCTEEADGRYRIETALLPRDASSQREQLIRRLAAKDSSIDLMSLDVIYVPEFAQAGFLADVPDELEGDPSGRAATPPGRDPEHPDAPGPGAAERTDLNASTTAEPDPPEGAAGP